MRLNGMGPRMFTVDVSDAELGKQIGNAMSQCVLERLLNKLIPAAGFANKVKADRWESGEAVKALEPSRDQTFMLPGGHEGEITKNKSKQARRDTLLELKSSVSILPTAKQMGVAEMGSR